MTIDFVALFAAFLVTPSGQALLVIVLGALLCPAAVFLVKVVWRVVLAVMLIVPRMIRRSIRQRELML